MMSILKLTYFTYCIKCFQKFPVLSLSLNHKFAFHTYSPLNLRKKAVKNFTENNQKPVISSVDLQQFGKVVAFDSEKVETFFDDIHMPKKKKIKENKLDKAVHDDSKINNKNTKTIKAKNISKNQNDNNNTKEDINKLKPNYKHSKNRYTISQVMENLYMRKVREKKQEILLEGKKLIKEAFSAGLTAKVIFYSRLSDLKDLQISENVEVCKTSYKELQLWSCNTTCPGIIGVFNLPKNKTKNENNLQLPITVICDNIREPGNLGAIIRVAAGAGCKKVILTKGCVDLWNIKVLRAGCGAHFKISFLTNAEWFNIEQEISEVEEIIIADNRSLFNNPNDNEKENQLENKNDSFGINVSSNNNLPLKNYTSVDYKKYNSIVFIVGGETQGISESAYKFALKRNGKRIFIPLINDIESLNSAVALGIILYETRKHMTDLLSNAFEKKSSECELLEVVA